MFSLQYKALDLFLKENSERYRECQIIQHTRNYLPSHALQ